MVSGKKLFTAELQRLRSGNPGGTGAAAPDNAEVLQAIESLRADIRNLEALIRPAPAEAAESEAEIEIEAVDPLKQQRAEVNILKTELRALAVCIEQTKQEIAALRPHHTEEDRLMAVTFELDAIVTATERATQTILESAEKIDNLTSAIQAQEKDGYIRHLADEITENVVTIFESCNFQDITGQRITKVVNTLEYIEDRVNAMIEIWGADTFADLDLPDQAQVQADEDAKLLNGPQLENKGISQDEIDKLFG